MNHSIYNCIDAGSENCPCYLAKTNDCLTCSRLQGKDYCDCNWRGICVYNEFILNKGRLNYPRKEFESRILSKKFYTDDLMVLQLEVDKGFAIKTLRPGTYIFLRKTDDEKYYDVPISILHVDVENSTIYVGIKVISPKTKALAGAKESIIVRGPYRNGIHGLTKVPKGKNILIVTKGIGVAPGIMAFNQLSANNQVAMGVDLDKVTNLIVTDFLKYDDKELFFLSLSQPEGRAALAKHMEQNQYDIIFLLMSDYYLDLVGKVIAETDFNGAIAMSNNYKLCCGEGICGSCSVLTDQGDVIRMCKCNNLPDLEQDS